MRHFVLILLLLVMNVFAADVTPVSVTTPQSANTSLSAIVGWRIAICNATKPP